MCLALLNFDIHSSTRSLNGAHLHLQHWSLAQAQRRWPPCPNPVLHDKCIHDGYSTSPLCMRCITDACTGPRTGPLRASLTWSFMRSALRPHYHTWIIIMAIMMVASYMDDGGISRNNEQGNSRNRMFNEYCSCICPFLFFIWFIWNFMVLFLHFYLAVFLGTFRIWSVCTLFISVCICTWLFYIHYISVFFSSVFCICRGERGPLHLS